jgi:membrane-associated phospholipid phosphatase
LLQRAGESLAEEKTLAGKKVRFPSRIWVLILLISSVAVVVAFLYLDVPVARRVYGLFGTAKSLGSGFSSVVLLGAEAGVALGLVISRITRGHLSPFSEATAVACLTSICAYAINDVVLKFVFGVPNPGDVMRGDPHVFHLLSGSSHSSFPSGHMVLAGAFGGVFMRLYRRSILPLSGLLLIGVVLLIVGDWHFLSDVIAGTFLGVSAGLLAGEVWLVHSR